MNLKNMVLLFVEDDLQIQSMVKDIIKDEVKEFHLASNGREGYDLYMEKKPDIIITDEKMPILNGLDMAIKIREHNENQYIILFTAMNDIDTLKRVINLNIDKLILKPLLNLEAFLENLEDIATNISIQNEIKKQNYELKEKNKIIDEYVLSSISDLDGNVVDVSSAFLKISGYKREEVIGKNHNIFRSKIYDKNLFADMWKILSKDLSWKGELKNRAKNGDVYWIKTVIAPLFDESGVKIGYKSIKEDITDRKKIEYLSEHDTLTGLYNRRKIERDLENYKDKIDRYNIECSLILIDLDKFKEVNDKFGHLVGDNILKEFAKIIQKKIRKTDTVARWGGEEFMIIIPHLNIEDTCRLAEKLREEIESYTFEKNIKITASFGLSSLGNYKTINDTVRQADEALYTSKRNGRNLVSISKED